MPNVFEPEWEREIDQPPFRLRGARVGAQAGAERLGASVYELPPGGASFPMHAHHANEEMIVVLAGRPTLRTPEGERELEPGELVACPVGRRGAHRLDNRGADPARVLVLSTLELPEVIEYPDSGKLAVRGAGFGEDPDALQLILRADATLGYFDGETD